jgi:hypothetical protein
MFFWVRFFTYDRYDSGRSFFFLFGCFLAFFFCSYYFLFYVFVVYFEDFEEEIEDEDYILTRELENEPQEDPYDQFSDDDFEEEIEILDFSEEPYLHVGTHPIPNYNNIDLDFYEMNLRTINFVVYANDFVVSNNNEFMNLFDC